MLAEIFYVEYMLIVDALSLSTSSSTLHIILLAYMQQHFIVQRVKVSSPCLKIHGFRCSSKILSLPTI